MLAFQTATPTEARKQFFELLEKVTDLPAEYSCD